MDKPAHEINTHPFFSEGNAMSKAIRATDWVKTPLGGPETWPDQLKTVVRVLLDMPYAMAIAWGNELIQLHNDAFRDVLESVGVQTAIGESMYITFADHWSSLSPRLTEATEGKKATYSYRTDPSKDTTNTSHHVNFTFSPLTDASGNVNGFVIAVVRTAQTISDGFAEGADRFQGTNESAETFRSMAACTDILIAVGDTSSNATFFNKAWVDLTGRPLQDLLKFGWVDLIHPDDKDRYVNIYLTAFEKRVPFTGEFRVLNKEGEYRWLLAKGPPLFAPDGTFEGYISSCIDITDQKNAFAQLEQSEEDLRNMVLAAPVGICLIDAPTRVSEVVNDSFLEVAGKPREAIIGKNYWEPFAEVAPYYEQALTDVVEKGISYYANEVEIMLIRHGKEELIFVTFVYAPIKDKEGKVKKVAVWVFDNTAQVLARKKVEQSEQEIRSLVEAAPFPIGVYRGKEMKVEFANQSIIDIWGKGNGVIGKLFSEVLPELENQEVFRQLDEVYASGLPIHIKNQRLDLLVEGKERIYYFNYSLTPLFDASGKVYGVMNTGVDLTELNLARRKLERSEKNLRNMVLQAPVAMCILVGPDHVIEVANDLMIELWGKPKGEVLSKPVFEALPDARNQGLEQVMSDAYHNGKTFTANEMPVNLLRNGKSDTVYQNFVYEPYRDSDGTILGVIAITIDVTAQVLARQQIEQVVTDRTKELEEANRSLQKSNLELAQFAYIASHDLQEPLRKISTFSEMLQANLGDRLDGRSKTFLNKIDTSTFRMNQLIRNVLAYSELGRVNEQFVPVDLNEVFDGVKTDYDLLIEQKAASVHCSSLPTVEAIPLQMSQLFANLLGNALKFSKKDVQPEINLSTQKLSRKEVEETPSLTAGLEYYKISLKDNGIGLKPEHAGRIFNIFQRLHRKSEFEGTGIGLAMCKKIALNHRGDIDAIGSSEDGAIFNIILPATQYVKNV